MAGLLVRLYRAVKETVVDAVSRDGLGVVSRGLVDTVAKRLMGAVKARVGRAKHASAACAAAATRSLMVRVCRKLKSVADPPSSVWRCAKDVGGPVGVVSCGIGRAEDSAVEPARFGALAETALRGEIGACKVSWKYSSAKLGSGERAAFGNTSAA